MKKSEVTEFFLNYFEKNRIEKRWISEKTGISERKLSKDYKQALNAEEFLRLCAFLQLQPEEILLILKKHRV